MSESLKTKAYEQIKSRILRCEYEPMSFLDVGAIANELGISRTPVRDAVSLLEQEELVQVLPRHGIMVLGISADLINDIINTRKIVEPFAARTAALKADEEIMNGIREVFCDPRADISALLEMDQKLHRYIVSCTENTYIIRMMDSIFSNSYRLMLSGSRMPGVFEISNREHIDIIDAIIERNPDRAEKRMLNHLSHSEQTSYEAAGILMRK
ncbi:MAG: GntR family transcriptional regulator [Oscillospiraceae bacterium]|jgi:DNA-binding GntR family transcriptional regulator|nr:GntR family transcriptional regulator [Oscillospiraceae bacterium]